jgi:alkylation response protein AidB-like acyl-CoA dehydrogenase
MAYRAPIAEILFTMRAAAGLDQGVRDGTYPDLADGVAEQVLAEAARLAENVLDPINRAGDREGCRLAEGIVTTAPGWKEAYALWRAGGWTGVTAPEEFGGMGLPHLLSAACQDIWNGGAMAFMLCPLLSTGAIEALVAHGGEDLRRLYLPKLVSGEWTATMNLTEPQAGSDLAGLRTRAERAGDGSYRLFGQKIFITYGEHDLCDNIIHFVLARLPDAPPGTRGISLFLAPKLLVGADGALGARNDLRCAGLEHKMGIHGSPTCTMIYGDGEGAQAWLVGEENRGLACMFTMMNSARLGVGLEGVACAERAAQQALAYALERRQGRAPGFSGEGMSPIVHHPDVARMLIRMKALTGAARAICYLTGAAADRAQRAASPEQRRMNAERAALLTPIAKAFSTDAGFEVASLNMQVHGGMGYIEETGAAQTLRDSRIAMIYEGTNGIQAIDLVARKLGLADGRAALREFADMRATIAEVKASNAPAFGRMGDRLAAALEALEKASQWLAGAAGGAPRDALAGATPYLRLFGLARGGVSLARLALAAAELADDDPLRAKIAEARFFAEHVAVEAPGLALAITEGARAIDDGRIALARDFS